MTEIVYKDESYAIIGACFEVYNEMGTGFVEPVYQECLEIELRDQEIPFVPQSSLELRYKRKILGFVSKRRIGRRIVGIAG